MANYFHFFFKEGIGKELHRPMPGISRWFWLPEHGSLKTVGINDLKFKSKRDILVRCRLIKKCNFIIIYHLWIMPMNSITLTVFKLSQKLYDPVSSCFPILCVFFVYRHESDIFFGYIKTVPKFQTISHWLVGHSFFVLIGERWITNQVYLLFFSKSELAPNCPIR